MTEEEWAGLPPLEGLMVTYIQAIAELRESVLSAFPQARNLREVIGLIRGQQLPLDGQVADGVRYRVHGAGCYMTDAQGREVDVDITAEGVEIFDAWRVLLFADSVGMMDRFNASDVEIVCRKMIRSGILEENRAGWFAVTSLTRNPFSRRFSPSR